MKKFLCIALMMLSIVSVQAQEWFTDVCDTVGKHRVQLELCKSHGPFVIYTGGNRQFTFCHLLKMGAGISIDGETRLPSAWARNTAS